MLNKNIQNSITNHILFIFIISTFLLNLKCGVSDSKPEEVRYDFAQYFPLNVGDRWYYSPEKQERRL